MPHLGYKVTEETKKKISKTMKGRLPKNFFVMQQLGWKADKPSGESHWLWAGDKVTYRTLHKWVERWLGKANHCSNDISHQSTRFHWANISKEYKRELSDWKQMCPSCNGLDRIGRRVSP